ncbi:MAG: hypothetical protein AB3N23_06805 [Paracoccaceae bacterium]
MFALLVRAFVLCAALLSATAGLAWEEPARGTKTRKALMDAIRPHAVWMLGEEIEFVVYDLRRQDGLAFASVYPQRPGGKPIDIASTPAMRRGQLDTEFMDGVTMQALYQRSGDT